MHNTNPMDEIMAPRVRQIEFKIAMSHRIAFNYTAEYHEKMTMMVATKVPVFQSESLLTYLLTYLFARWCK